MTQTFEFNVFNGDGLWGQMRVAAEDADIAASAISEDLRREEVEPNGSLSADFRVVRV